MRVDGCVNVTCTQFRQPEAIPEFPGRPIVSVGK
eukprot:COSAG02_NODE_27687_length_604_cov_1.554455_1_plen_33_part_10